MKRLSSSAVIVIVVLVLVGACVGFVIGASPDDDDSVTLLQSDDIPLSVTSAPPLTPEVYAGSKSEIIATGKVNGSISVRSLVTTSKRLKVKVIKLENNDVEASQLVYDLNGQQKPEAFPLQFGDGKYCIKVFENVENTKYSVIQTATIDVKLRSEFAPFLISSQMVNYDASPTAVKLAGDLTKGNDTELSKVQAIYAFVVNQITYDNQKAKDVIDGKLTGYVPQLDAILAKKSGICFDYSSLLSAMLRSQGIPTKLVMGYVAPDNVYHAWNEVYVTGKGWIKINSSIQFTGQSWSRMDSTFAAGNKDGALTSFISNSTNYSGRTYY